MYKARIEKTMKKIPEEANTGAYPMFWAITPAYNTEPNSANLKGTINNPMSTETFGLSFVALAMIDS